MNQKLEPAKPWYHYRWPWLLMLGPFVVVVAGAITAWLAFRSSDGLVADDYYKQGLAINQVTSRDRRAAALGLAAEMTFDPTRKLIRVALVGGKTDVPKSLILKLSHPTRGGLDQSLRLQRDESGGYSAAPAGELAGRWRVALEDDVGEWRLTATWEVAQQPVLALVAAK